MNYGWICQRCGASNSPTLAQCTCQPDLDLLLPFGGSSIPDYLRPPWIITSDKTVFDKDRFPQHPDIPVGGYTNQPCDFPSKWTSGGIVPDGPRYVIEDTDILPLNVAETMIKLQNRWMEKLDRNGSEKGNP